MASGEVKVTNVKRNGLDDIPRPFIIGVAGGTASGKSTVCERIMQHLGQNEVEKKKRQVVTISMDSFYRKLSKEEDIQAKKGQFNFDHPNAFDEGLILDTINKMIDGSPVELPVYDYLENKIKSEGKITIYPADVVVFEGILAFYFKDIRDKFHMKLFVDTDPDTRLSRRVMKDVKEFHRDIDQILYQYTSFVKPAFEEFCLPTKKYADVIIPRGADNTVAIELIVQHIQDLLRPSKNQLPKRTRTNSDSLLVFRTGDMSTGNYQEKYSSAH